MTSAGGIPPAEPLGPSEGPDRGAPLGPAEQNGEFLARLALGAPAEPSALAPVPSAESPRFDALVRVLRAGAAAAEPPERILRAAVGAELARAFGPGVPSQVVEHVARAFEEHAELASLYRQLFARAREVA